MHLLLCNWRFVYELPTGEKFNLLENVIYASVREWLYVWSFRKGQSIRAIHLNIFCRSERACYVTTLYFRLRSYHFFVKFAILLCSYIQTCVTQNFYSYFYGEKILLGVLVYFPIIKNFPALSETEMFTINPHRFKWFTVLFNPTLIHISATHIIISIVIPQWVRENLRIATGLESFSWNQWARNPTLTFRWPCIVINSYDKTN